MKCPECGKDIPEDLKYCPYCGHKLPDPSEGNVFIKLRRQGVLSNKRIIIASALLMLMLFIVIANIIDNKPIEEDMPDVIDQRLDKALDTIGEYINYNNRKLHLVHYIEGKNPANSYDASVRDSEIERYFVLDTTPNAGETITVNKDDLYLAVKNIGELFDEHASETCDVAEKLGNRLGVNVIYEDDDDNNLTSQVKKNNKKWLIDWASDWLSYEEETNTITVHVKKNKEYAGANVKPTRPKKGKDSLKKEEKTSSKTTKKQSVKSYKGENIRTEVHDWCLEMDQVYILVKKLSDQLAKNDYMGYGYFADDYNQYEKEYHDLQAREPGIRSLGLNNEEIYAMDEMNKKWKKLKEKHDIIYGW